MIGLISDTHDNVRAMRELGRAFRERGVEMVIHAGDWVSAFSLLRMRRAVGSGVRIVGVLGNNEGEIKYFYKRAEEANIELLGEAGLVEVDGLKIGVYHGTSEILLEAMVRSGMFDVVVYGHTHRIDIRRVNGTLVVNPGEACGCATERATAAILDTRTLNVEIIEAKPF